MIELIKWHDHFSVNSELIDSQHKQLIRMINELYTAFKSIDRQEAIAAIIIELKAYTVFHFQTEERLFAEFNYPHTEEHKKEHQMFVDKVLDFESKFKEMKPILIFEIMTFLRQWLVHHILEEDMKYVTYLFPE